MYKNIERALSLRISLIEFLRRIKSMDNSISGLEFKHSNYTGDDFANQFSMWNEWETIVNDYITVKNSMLSSEISDKLPIHVSETRNKVAAVLKRTILEVLAELIVCDIYIDKLIVSTSGIEICSSEDSNYHSFYNDRYIFPLELKEKLNSLSLIDEEIVNAVLDDLEAHSEDHLWYLDFKKPAILINLAVE